MQLPGRAATHDAPVAWLTPRMDVRLQRLRGPRIAGAVTIAVLPAVAISGCGSGAKVSGRAVFAADCAVCHSISGSSAPTQQGGDLRGLRLPRNDLVQYTVEMPVLNKPLNRAQVRAVVDYMQSIERKS